MVDPDHSITDQDIVQFIRQDMPYSRVQMVWGNLRRKCYKVSHEHVHTALRHIDPLNGLRKWPSLIHTQYLAPTLYGILAEVEISGGHRSFSGQLITSKLYIALP